MAKTANKAPSKKCPKCGKENHARSAKCKYCETPFPPPKPKADKPNATRKARGKGKANPSPVSNAYASAIDLVKVAGGFDRAKAILAELEQVKSL
jgi:hypothetical protein